MRRAIGFAFLILLAASLAPHAAWAWSETRLPSGSDSGTSNFADPDEKVDQFTGGAQSSDSGQSTSTIQTGAGALSFSVGQPGSQSSRSQYGNAFGPGWSPIGQ